MVLASVSEQRGAMPSGAARLVAWVPVGLVGTAEQAHAMDGWLERHNTKVFPDVKRWKVHSCLEANRGIREQLLKT